MSTPELITFGCRLNTVESEVMRNQAIAAGADDAVIINTCAVTNEAVRQARQAIRKARRNRPGAQIVVTGCAAQLEPETFADMPEVDRILGNTEKLTAEAYSDFGVGAAEKIRVNDIMSVRETAGHMLNSFEGRTRAFVQVQNGCDHRCTFCIIPFARGNSRSVPMGEVVRQVEALIDNGYQEIVLTGVDITSYGADLPGTPTLGRLCETILRLVPDLPRLRLSSIDSFEIDPLLEDLLATAPRLMPHVHLSLQAGDDMILKRMKRRHTRAQAIAFTDRLRARRPDIAFGADLIAGFPTETDAMFENTAAMIGEAGLSFLHVFPYSERQGTPAAKMPQVPGDVRRERAARLRAEGDKVRGNFFAHQIGSKRSVLIEDNLDGEAKGHTEQFAPIRFATTETGIARVHVEGWDERGLKGRLAA